MLFHEGSSQIFQIDRSSTMEKKIIICMEIPRATDDKSKEFRLILYTTNEYLSSMTTIHLLYIELIEIL